MAESVAGCAAERYVMRVTQEGEAMEYNEDFERYVDEYKDLLFAWDDPDEDRSDDERRLAEEYYSHLDDIVGFMLPDLRVIYGDVTVEEVKDKLGRPLIDYDNGTVSYYEQSFDGDHIFEFEFLDDEFSDLQYFSIDG